MTYTQKYLLYGSIVILVLSVMYLLGASSARVDARTTSGIPSSLAVATTTTVGPQQNIQLFAANAGCTSRIISTVAVPIMLIFADPSNGDVSSTTLSGVKGHLQSASTTSAYDSGLYGCGRVFAYGFSSTTITVTEER